MAISDILSDAVSEIRECLEYMPEVYQDIRLRLDQLLSDMDAIRVELDTPPKD